MRDSLSLATLLLVSTVFVYAAPNTNSAMGRGLSSSAAEASDLLHETLGAIGGNDTLSLVQGLSMKSST